MTATSTAGASAAITARSATAATISRRRRGRATQARSSAAAATPAARAASAPRPAAQNAIQGAVSAKSPQPTIAAWVSREIGSHRRNQALGVSKSARAGAADKISQPDHNASRTEGDDATTRSMSRGRMPLPPKTIAENSRIPQASGKA